MGGGLCGWHLQADEALVWLQCVWARDGGLTWTRGWLWDFAGAESSGAVERTEYAIRFDEHRFDNDGNPSEPGCESGNEPRPSFGPEQSQSRSERAEQLAEPVPELSAEFVVVFVGAAAEPIDKRFSELEPEPPNFAGDGILWFAIGNVAVRRSGEWNWRAA